MATRRLPRDVEAAVAHWGPKANKVAERYNISGRSLLAKLTMGESGGRANAVSSAGARKWFQFMPQTAAAARAKGADPYKSADQAAEAAVMHLRGVLGHRKGLEGYNPGGGQGYVRYILGQKVRVPGPGGGDAASGGGASSEPGVVGGSTQRSLPEPGGTGMAEILAAALQRPQGPTVSAPPEPAYSARRALRMPQGYSPTQSAPAGPSQAQTVADAIQALSKVRGPGIAKSDSTATAGGESASGGSAPSGGKGGKIDLSPRGGWAGTEGPARKLAQIGTGLGLNVISKKRPTRNTSSGGVSDHYAGNRSAMAYDLSNGSAPTPQMDEAAYRIARALGIPYKKGTEIAQSVTRNGIRYQVIYRSNVGGNHFNHVHLGARRV